LVVLADVRAAQASLAQNESEQALSLLSGVPDGLEALQAAVPGESQGEVDSMMSRVTLAIEGIETDQFAAQSDLEVLANSLIQLENNLFVTP
jgi:hypothetical protein